MNCLEHSICISLLLGTNISHPNTGERQFFRVWHRKTFWHYWRGGRRHQMWGMPWKPQNSKIIISNRCDYIFLYFKIHNYYFYFRAKFFISLPIVTMSIFFIHSQKHHTWKSIWIYLKSQIEFWNLKILFKSEKKIMLSENLFQT